MVLNDHNLGNSNVIGFLFFTKSSISSGILNILSKWPVIIKVGTLF